MNVLNKMQTQVKKDGSAIVVLRCIRKIANKIFNLVVFKRKDIYIDYTARIIGNSHFTIGKNFYAGKHLWIEAVGQYMNYAYNPKIEIGDNVSVQDSVHIGAANHIHIGDNVLLASKIYISDHNHGIYDGENQSNPNIPPALRELTHDKEIIIENNAWIGESVTILPGAHIGEGSIVGANSVVSGDIPAFSIAVGTPARVIKKYDLNSNKWVKIIWDEDDHNI